MSRCTLLVSWFFTCLGMALLALLPFVAPQSVFADAGMDCIASCMPYVGTPQWMTCSMDCCATACGSDQSCVETCCSKTCAGTDNECYTICAKIPCPVVQKTCQIGTKCPDQWTFNVACDDKLTDCNLDPKQCANCICNKSGGASCACKSKK